MVVTVSGILMLFSAEHPEKAAVDISSKSLGKTTFCKLLQEAKNLSGSFFTSSGRRTFCSPLYENISLPQPSILPSMTASSKLLHQQKQASPTYVTLSSIVTEVNPVLTNALAPILCKFEGKSMLVNFLHVSNALFPILCKFEGKSMLSNLLQFRNALFPIFVTVSGNTTLASALHPAKVLA